MKKIIYIYFLLAISLVAIPALAQVRTFRQLVENVFIGSILRPIVPVLIGMAVVVFIYGILTVMFSEGGEKKESGKQFMIWGIVGIFVMVSVWGLVAILRDSFQLNINPQTIQITVPNTN